MTSSAIAKRLQSLQDKAAMKAVDVANVVGTRPETVSRWNQGKAFPRSDAEKILLDLEYIVDQLADFYSPEEARLWLLSRQKLLDGARPVDLVKAGSTDRVLELVNQLRDGVYV